MYIAKGEELKSPYTFKLRQGFDLFLNILQVIFASLNNPLQHKI
ncbi:hypothetical protein [Priestia aryabhattai]